MNVNDFLIIWAWAGGVVFVVGAVGVLATDHPTDRRFAARMAVAGLFLPVTAVLGVVAFTAYLLYLTFSRGTDD